QYAAASPILRSAIKKAGDSRNCTFALAEVSADILHLLLQWIKRNIYQLEADGDCDERPNDGSQTYEELADLVFAESFVPLSNLNNIYIPKNHLAFFTKNRDSLTNLANAAFYLQIKPLAVLFAK